MRTPLQFGSRTSVREMKQDRLALDRGSIRAIDENSGHLHVSQTPISKANICPYWGAEIPDYEALGLKPDQTYKLLRDPEELEKAAKSFDGKPLLIKHRAQSADDHDHDAVVGSVSNVVWDAPYLKADLSVWDGDAIKAIESNKQRQLSCGYFYRADMTPGTHQGERYDGRMVDIAGNHTALVDEGRAGPDVMVGDSKPKSKPRRLPMANDDNDDTRMKLLNFLAGKLDGDALLQAIKIIDGENESDDDDADSEQAQDRRRQAADARMRAATARRTQTAADEARRAKLFPNAGRLR